ncbi:MAG TPA: cob(I)yrinic acid a,c-diamide adenosyltransferase [Chthoniobacterales bacterium]|jgi:ATP:cob(I)alamin adenosyltransferase|nr:cob(I)yrinic acid a,c-diamide adenosyltransferase [Chthoniobacterales bacterium]
MSIVTKTGDKGETSLMYGRRLPKNNPRSEAYGAADELTSALGLARASCDDKFVTEQIFAVQNDLINVMGELSTLPEDRQRYAKDGFQIVDAKMVDRIGAVIVDLEKDKSLFPKDWVIPGENAVSAALDLARAVCRRGERNVAALNDPNPEILRYLNRLSDYCWILARLVEARHKKTR